MGFALQPDAALRVVAWTVALLLGLRVLVRRSDAAGRAFAFWVVVWGGGVQLLLSLDAMATDDATAQLLYRVSYYAVLASSSAFLVALLYAPERVRRANLLLAVLLGVPLLVGLVFAGAHGAFLVERSGPYAPSNTPLMAALFHPFVWTGFLAGMLWLAWRAPRCTGATRASARWLMAGLGLFAGDRFARTATAWVRDPTSIGAGIEGIVYGLFMLAFGFAVLAMVLRSRGMAGTGNVRLATLLGLAVGATTIVTFGMQQLGGGLTAGTVLSALLGPVYTALLAKGVIAAPRDATVLAAGRAAVLAEA